MKALHWNRSDNQKGKAERERERERKRERERSFSLERRGDSRRAGNAMGRIRKDSAIGKHCRNLKSEQKTHTEAMNLEQQGVLLVNDVAECRKQSAT